MADDIRPPRPAVLPFRPEGIPQELRQMDRWVLWDHIWREKAQKWVKMPFRSGHRPASSTDPSTWTSYDKAYASFTAAAMGDRPYAGLGFMLGDGLVGVDLDDCVDPLFGDLNPQSEHILGLVSGYAETSPSGMGVKIITRASLDRSFTDHSRGIEVYADHRYFAITGHQINGHAALPVDGIDLGPLVGKMREDRSATRDLIPSGGAFADFRPSPPLDLSEEEIDAALAAIPERAEGYAEWLEVGQALHHQYGGADDGLEKWDNWSSQASSYTGFDACLEKWTTFNRFRQGITFASVLFHAKPVLEAQIKEARLSALDTWVSEIRSAADLATLMDQLPSLIAEDERLEQVHRNLLAGHIVTRSKQLNHPLLVADVRRLLNARRLPEQPEWLTHWVYCSMTDRFHRRADPRKALLPSAFDTIMRPRMPVFEGFRPTPHIYAAEMGIQCVDRPGYSPYDPSSQDAAIYHWSGGTYLNTYRPASVPERPAHGKRIGAAAILDRHLHLLCPNPEHYKILRQWLSYKVRHPGHRIQYTIVLKGVEGDGKTKIAEAAACAMGQENVQFLAASSIEASTFTGWGEGFSLNVVEEIKLHGHNRYDVLNRLKPFITNDTVEIHRKGKDPYNSRNVTGYLLFTNYDDALPVTDHDRRHCVLFTPWKSIDDLHFVISNIYGIEVEEYWEQLAEALREGAWELREYFLDTDLADFNPWSRAPETEYKRVMRQSSKADDELLLDELLEEGHPGVHPEVISTRHLADIMAERGERPKTQRLRKLLKAAGYAHASVLRWSGVTLRVAVKETLTLTADDIRQRLDTTVTAAFEERP